jgi:hypothetical protein
MLAVLALALYALHTRRRLAAEAARADMYRALVADRDGELARLGR